MNTSILDFGAVCDGRTICTKEIQSAIDACAHSGGGRVTVPAGIYVSGSIWLRDNVELHLEHGAVIKGSTNMDDYNDEDAYEQNFSSRTNEKWLGKHLIIAHECQNVAITGTGTLDGSADAFLGDVEFYSVHLWRDGLRTSKDLSVLRPGQLVCFIECKHVTVRDVTLTNQPCWGCFLHGCEYVSVSGLHIFNDPTFVNSDGIDIDCCRYVTVSDCMIDTGDDAVAIRADLARMKNKNAVCENITVSNCVLGSSSCGIRIGVGTGIIRHVRINNLTVTRAAPLFYFMSSYLKRGHVTIEDVCISNVSATNCAGLIGIVETTNTPIRNITVENLVAEACDYCNLHPDIDTSVSDITLRNWNVTLTEPPKPSTEKDIQRMGTYWFRAKNITRLTLENFILNDPNSYLSAWKDGAFCFENCNELKRT